MSTREQGSIVRSAEQHSIAESIAGLLRDEIGDDRYEMWFSHSESVVFDADRRLVTIQSDNEFSLRRLQQSFQASIRQAIDLVCGQGTELLFLVAADHDVTESDSAEVQQQLAFPMTTDSAASIPKPRRAVPSLREFQFHPESPLLKAGVAQVVARPGQYSPLFVYGPTGSGKTYLLEAVVNEYRRKLRLKKCLYVSADQFTSQFVASIRNGSGLPMFRRKFQGLDLLAIDDIQFFVGKRATLDEFQQTLDYLVRQGKQIILAADRTPMELGELGTDICTRLASGLQCGSQYPDFSGRVKIAQNMCETRDFQLPLDVLELVCEKLPRDVRRISGAINRLQAYASAFGDTITVSFACEVLEDLFSLAGPVCSTMKSIEKAVCDFCQVKPQELKSNSRQRRISTARMLAMYLSREYTGAAFSEIGEFFGGRSHSTVIAASKKVKTWLDTNHGLSLPHAKFTAKQAVERLEANLRIG